MKNHVQQVLVRITSKKAKQHQSKCKALKDMKASELSSGGQTSNIKGKKVKSLRFNSPCYVIS